MQMRLVEDNVTLSSHDPDPNYDGGAPLHFCFLDKKCKVLLEKLLSVQDLDVDIRNNFGNTPLILALHERDFEGVDMLLAKDANPNAHNDQGVT